MAEVGVLEEFESRVLIKELKRNYKIAPEDDPVADNEDLIQAINYCQRGDIGMCGHYLIRAIPQLHPLGRILGA